MMFPLALAVAISLTAGDRPHPVRPHPVAKPRPPPKPEPPPEDDAFPTEPDIEPMPEEPPPGPATSPEEPEHTADGSLDKITDEQAGVLILVGGCCCFLFVGAFGVLIYFLVRKKPAAPGVAPPPYAAAAPPAPAPAPFHLSVLAVGLSSVAREAVAQQLLLGGVSTAPATAAERAHLVRELAKALRLSETHWSHFGYGERLDLFDEAAAARSYQLAVDDFKKRSDAGSLSGDASYVVATLVLCTRRQLRGVSSLDDRAQIRTMLEDRSALVEGELMGAFLVWSPPLGGSEVLTRFPEMHALR